MALQCSTSGTVLHTRTSRWSCWCATVSRCSVTATAAAARSSAQDIDPRVYTDAAVQPAPFVGPVAVVEVPGKGRGLVATQPLVPGQLLLVVPPLALVTGGLGDIPEHEELQEVIAASGGLFSPWQAAWLKALTTSTTRSTDSEDDSTHASSSSSSGRGRAAEVPSLLPPPGEAAWWGAGSSDGSSAGSSVGSAGSSGRVVFKSLGLDEEQLWAAIVLNCYGEEFQDLPASLCAGAELTSQLALFGAFSLLNHSCCPNAVNYTLRDSMVVRCCRPVATGQEIEINYAGRGALRPLSQRQVELQACYGFSCCCPRCQEEAGWAGLRTAGGLPLSQLLDSLQGDIGHTYEPRLAQLRARLVAAQTQQQEQAEQRGQEQQQVVLQELADLAAAMHQQWQAVLSACAGDSSRSSSSSSTAGGTGEPACTPTWVLAAAYDLLGLLHEAQEAAGQPDPAVLDAMLAVTQSVCPGSDLHLFQALCRTSVAQRSSGGGDGDVERAAFDALRQALGVRYGPQVLQDEGLLERMVSATSQAASMVVL